LVQRTGRAVAVADPALAWSNKLRVEVGGAETIAHAGVVAPRLLADRLGLTGDLAGVVAQPDPEDPTRLGVGRRRGHRLDPHPRPTPRLNPPPRPDDSTPPPARGTGAHPSTSGAPSRPPDLTTPQLPVTRPHPVRRSQREASRPMHLPRLFGGLIWLQGRTPVRTRGGRLPWPVGSVSGC
jgi:hypothetical protein